MHLQMLWLSLQNGLRKADNNNHYSLLLWAVRKLTGYGDKLYIVSAEAVNFLHPDFFVPETTKCSPSEFEDMIASHNSDMVPILTLLLDQIYFLSMKALAIMVFVQIVGRAFELTVYTLLAPLPLATFASDGCSDVAKNFIKKYIACVLQITVIITMFLAYQGLMNVAEFTGLMQFASFIALSMGVMKSGQWSKNICGTN